MMYRLSRFILEMFIRMFFRIKVFGRENIPEAPYIIVPNHASLLDPPLVGIACNKHNIAFLAKEELFTTPIIGIWSRSVGCLCAKRGANSIKSLRDALKKTQEGGVVCIFPEGTRSSDGDLQQAKRGVGFLIARAKVPLVPVYVDGTAKAMPKTGGFKRGSLLRVFVGKPLYPAQFLLSEDIGKKNYQHVTEIVMKSIAELKDEVLNGRFDRV
ncbi:MAG: lysophospholipid acyltransferase family protein [Candidatus Omnitrophota bacterium]